MGTSDPAAESIDSRLKAPQAPGKNLHPAVRDGLFAPLVLACVVVFLVLYLGSGATDVWFAWTMASPLTATTVGAGFGAAVVLLFLAALEPGWTNARIASFAPLVMAAGSLVVTKHYQAELNPPRELAIAGTAFSVPVPDIWLIALGITILLTVLTVPAQLLRRVDVDGVAVATPIPGWARVFAGIEGMGLLVAGIGATVRPGPYVAWWPWPVSAFDLRELSVWSITLGLLIVYAAVVGDLRQAAVGLAALVVFGLLALGGVLRYAGDLRWGSPGALIVVSAMVLLLGTGFFGLVLLGLARVVRPVLTAVTTGKPGQPPSEASAWELARGIRSKITPHDDRGFFGPGSVTWKVWTYPTSLTVGFQRAVVVEELDPALVAAVDKTKALRTRSHTRYDRTLRYFAMVAFAGTRVTMKASDILVKVHSTGVGVDPVTGKRYDANDPASQLWIHLTAWHSILYAYEKYGPGRLSAEEEARYWADCATAAELQTCDPAEVPRDREGVRAYFERMRPQLVGSPVARSTMDHLLHAEVMLPPMPPAYWPAVLVITRTLRVATIASMPHWMRDLAGIRQSRLLDALVVPVMRLSFRFIRMSSWLQLAALRLLSPSTLPIVAPVLLGIAPATEETLTPAQARERFGYTPPALAHLELRARQRERVFKENRAPDDVGLVESEPVLGAR
ncbi:oxygenase MpaB family protein [Amycolatopsis sp. cmx-11-12]|uniref:oxygenase MpaB family protein n=1 Tax=Amycolatopsis sp. cmx-11-12 TaxID=2785795 RepID=UPI0039180C93